MEIYLNECAKFARIFLIAVAFSLAELIGISAITKSPAKKEEAKDWLGAELLITATNIALLQGGF